jgi:hypothetical protein
VTAKILSVSVLLYYKIGMMETIKKEELTKKELAVKSYQKNRSISLQVLLQPLDDGFCKWYG